MVQKSIMINEWKNGVSDSPYEAGISLARLVDIEAFPNTVKVQKKMYSKFTPSLSTTFTVNAGTDVITLVSGVAPGTGAAVTFTTTVTLPAGLVAGTTYFTININATTFKVATTIANAEAGTPVDITDAGTGVHTVATTNPGTIKHIIKDPRIDVYYCQDSNARVWYKDGSLFFRLLVGNTLTNGSGNGIVLFATSDATATYLFAFRNGVVDVVNVFGTSNYQNPSWSNSWQSLNAPAGISNSSHYVKVGQDNIIYFCDAKYVGSIKELSIFDPSTGGTFNFNNQALDLPQGEIAEWFDELGVNLEIAGKNFNKIYPWDRISSSFNLPIIVPENLIKKVINLGNYLYIFAGTTGNIYRTQGAGVELVRKIPDYLLNNSGALLPVVTWGGVATRNGAILVGVGGLTSGNSGVYLLYPDGRLIMDNMPLTGSANVTAIYAENEFYYIGFAGGVNNMITGQSGESPARYSSFEAVVHSALFPVANKTVKGKFSELEVQTGKPMTSAGHIRIKYRGDTSSAFADFPTAVSYTGDSAAISFATDIGLIDVENIQIQVEMDGDIELRTIELRP